MVAMQAKVKLIDGSHDSVKSGGDRTYWGTLGNLWGELFVCTATSSCKILSAGSRSDLARFQPVFASWCQPLACALATSRPGNPTTLDLPATLHLPLASLRNLPGSYSHPCVQLVLAAAPADCHSPPEKESRQPPGLAAFCPACALLPRSREAAGPCYAGPCSFTLSGFL